MFVPDIIQVKISSDGAELVCGGVGLGRVE